VTLLILFVIFGISMFLGMPIAFAIGFSSLVVAIITGLPLSLLITKIFAGVDSFTILAVPFFVLAGEVMNQSGITDRIIRLASDLVGHLRGGLAHVNILTSMIFAGISGSCMADSAAIGNILIPKMISEKYPADFSVVITATSSTIGPIIPPSLIMVLYSYLTGVSVGALFLGGAIPGILIGFALMSASYVYCKIKKYGEPQKRPLFKEMIISFFKALPALVMPFIIVGGIVSGIFTATEAGSIAVVYGLFFGFIVYKTMNFRKLWKSVSKSAVLVGGLLFLVATSRIFGHLLAREQVHEIIYDFLMVISPNPMVVLLVIMVIILIMGMFIDVGPMVIMFAPTFSLVARHFGLNPIHFGVVFCMTALIGATTPPVGVLLFIDCAIAKIPLSKTFKIIWPFVLVLFFVCVLAAFFPNIVLFLPELFYK